jgi:hypothetical protein
VRDKFGFACTVVPRAGVYRGDRISDKHQPSHQTGGRWNANAGCLSSVDTATTAVVATAAVHPLVHFPSSNLTIGHQSFSSIYLMYVLEIQFPVYGFRDDRIFKI